MALLDLLVYHDMDALDGTNFNIGDNAARS